MTSAASWPCVPSPVRHCQSDWGQISIIHREIPPQITWRPVLSSFPIFMDRLIWFYHIANCEMILWLFWDLNQGPLDPDICSLSPFSLRLRVGKHIIDHWSLMTIYEELLKINENGAYGYQWYICQQGRELISRLQLLAVTIEVLILLKFYWFFFSFFILFLMAIQNWYWKLRWLLRIWKPKKFLLLFVICSCSVKF